MNSMEIYANFLNGFKMVRKQNIFYVLSGFQLLEYARQTVPSPIPQSSPQIFIYSLQ